MFANERLDWGEAIEFYLVAHRWLPTAKHVMSILRKRLGALQDPYINALIRAGMPHAEAIYFNMLLEKEGVRRRQEPHEFRMIA